jgi:hypothetical protein
MPSRTDSDSLEAEVRHRQTWVVRDGLWISDTDRHIPANCGPSGEQPALQGTFDLENDAFPVNFDKDGVHLPT